MTTRQRYIVNSEARSIRPADETVGDLPTGARFYPASMVGDSAQLCVVMRQGTHLRTDAGAFVRCQYVNGGIPVLQPAELHIVRE